MRGTKKYKIVKCFRHFGAIIILLWLISIVRFPYSFDKLQVLSNKNFESVSNSLLTLVDCKSTESKSSIDFLLTDKVIEHLNHAHLDALLNPPTNDMILEHLKKEMGHIPADYIEFLKQCNGLTLYHSGDYCLFDAQEILSFHFSNDNLLCRSAWKIGYWMGYDIVINVDDIEKEYLYAGDCCSTDEFICVGNILNFIEEIVKNGGDPYWTINENQYRDFSKK